MAPLTCLVLRVVAGLLVSSTALAHPAAAQVEWQQVSDGASPRELSWEPVPPAEAIPPESPVRPVQAPATASTKATLQPAPTPLMVVPTAAVPNPAPSTRSSPLGPPLHLGFAVPTANRLEDAKLEVRFTQISADSGGQSGGTGNQNYAARFDFALSDAWMVSGFYSEADDPLYATIQGKANPVANFWQVLGASTRLRLAGDTPLWPQLPRWEWALEGSLEAFNVGSGCGGSVSCSSSGGANIFNNSGRKVYTTNLVGALSLPFSWRASDTLQLTFTPAVTFLPDRQGVGQGGGGTFYGDNVSLSAGASWRPLPELELLGSVSVPLGPGTNSFDRNLEFSRVPIFTLAANVAFNPRISLQGAVTNGFGVSPATALLALPSDNRALFSASLRWNPGEPDTPQGELTLRQRSFGLGGLSANTAWVPPSGTWQLSANADSRGNLFGFVGWSASNIFQFEFFHGGEFNNVEPRNALVDTYANDDAFSIRFGAKLVAFSQLRGAPFTGAGRISVGRNFGDNYQGYLFGELLGTWEASKDLAFSLSPKVAWSGVESPWGFGLAANIQLAKNWQLIPELNLVASDIDSSNGTLAIRWLPTNFVFVDVYASTAAGLYDIGTLLRSDQVRVGTRLNVLF